MFVIVATAVMLFMALFSSKALFGGDRWLITGFVMFLLMFMAFAARMYLARIGQNQLIIIMAWVGYTAIGVVSILFCAAVIKVLFGTAGWLVTKASSEFSPARRIFLSNTLGSALSLSVVPLTAYGVYKAVGNPIIKKLRIAKKGLPDALDGFKIVQVTDIHAGPTIGPETVANIVSMVNGLNPDVVLITGDLVDGSAKFISDYITPLTGLKSTHGTFFTTGNHEYYSGVTEWTALIKKLGITVLDNGNSVLEHNGAGLMIAGVPDTQAASFGFEPYDPFKAKKTDKGYDFSVIMSHRPEIAGDIAKAGYDLQLSGHTHGGQYFPWTVVVYLFHKYVKGMYRVDDMSLYVSQGTAYWGPPLRIGTQSEITQVTLHKA